MGIITPTLPTPGQPRGSEETDVRNALTAIVNAINGSLDLANLSAAAKTALFGYWRTLAAEAGMAGDAFTNAVPTYYFRATSIFPETSFMAEGGPPSLLPIHAADLAVAGLTTKLRVRAFIACNGVDAGASITVGLYPVSSYESAVDGLRVNLGAAAASVALNPSVNAAVEGVSGEINIPADGIYALGCELAAAIATNSLVSIHAVLQVRHV